MISARCFSRYVTKAAHDSGFLACTSPRRYARAASVRPCHRWSSRRATWTAFSCLVRATMLINSPTFLSRWYQARITGTGWPNSSANWQRIVFGVIRDCYDRQRLSPCRIGLPELPPDTFRPRDHLLTCCIDSRREVAEVPCRLFQQPDIDVHTLGLALQCGLARPLAPTRFLLFDLHRIRQEQHFLTLGVIPIHLWHHRR